MALPFTLANGRGNLPDATQLMANFSYLEALASQNILINGGFDFWQRGTSFNCSNTKSYTADRWYMSGNGTVATGTVSQDSGNLDGAGSYSMKINVTGNTSNLGFFLSQIVENFKDYIGKTLTLTVRAKASSLSGGSFFIGWQDGVGGGSNIAISNSGGFVTYTATSTVLAGTTGIQVLIGNWFGAISPTGTVYIASVVLSVGSQVLPYIARPYAQELALCQRYYQKSFAQGTTPGHNIAANFLWLPTCTGGVAGNTYFGLPYKVEMRVAPTVYLFDPMATGSVNAVHIYRSGAGTQMTSFAMLGSTIGITGNCAGGNAGYADDMIAAHYAADAEM